MDAAGVGHQFRQFLGRWSCWSWPPTPPTPATLRWSCWSWPPTPPTPSTLELLESAANSGNSGNSVAGVAGVGHQLRQLRQLRRWSCWSWPPTPPTPASLETPPLGGDTVLLPVHHRLVELRGLVVQWWCKGGAMQTSKRYKIEINDFHFRDTSSRAFFPHSWWGMGSVTHAPPAAGAQRPGGEWVAEWLGSWWCRGCATPPPPADKPYRYPYTTGCWSSAAWWCVGRVTPLPPGQNKILEETWKFDWPLRTKHFVPWLRTKWMVMLRALRSMSPRRPGRNCESLLVPPKWKCLVLWSRKILFLRLGTAETSKFGKIYFRYLSEKYTCEKLNLWFLYLDLR